MDNFIKKLNHIYPLTEESFAKLLNICEVVTCAPKDKLTKRGERSFYFYYLIEGYVRSYSSSNSKEINQYLFRKDQFPSNLESLITGNPTKNTLECINHCKLIKINYANFIKLTENNLEISILYRRSLESTYYILQQRDFDLANLTSTERYLKLIENNSRIELFVPQKIIASYLGMTRMQLSRLKKTLRSNINNIC